MAPRWSALPISGISSPWGSPGPVTCFWWIECGKGDETTLLRLDYKRLTSDLLEPLYLSVDPSSFLVLIRQAVICDLSWGEAHVAEDPEWPSANSQWITVQQLTKNTANTRFSELGSWSLPSQALRWLGSSLNLWLEPWERPWAKGSLEALPRVLTRM